MQQYSWPTNALLRDFNPKTPNVRWSLFVLVQQRSAVAASKQQNGGMCIHPHVDSTNLYIFTPRYSESIRKYQRSRGTKAKGTLSAGPMTDQKSTTSGTSGEDGPRRASVFVAARRGRCRIPRRTGWRCLSYPGSSGWWWRRTSAGLCWRACVWRTRTAAWC